MKRLLIALMAVSMVLVAVSFAAAQSASAIGSIESFQAIIPPGTASGVVASPGITAAFITSNQMPIMSNNPSASGAASTAGGYFANAAGGGSQLGVTAGYAVAQAGGAHVTVFGTVF